MSIVVTGGTGKLGRLVIENLLDRGVTASDITAAGRDLPKIADLAERGIHTVAIDYTDPASLRAAFAGAEKVLLISGSEVGQRVPQHRNAIDAAAQSGVRDLVYTSVVNADALTMQLATEHYATEQALQDAPLRTTVLRNGWYIENYTGQLANYLQHGAILGCAKDGRISAATRADFAAAAAAVLTSDGHEGKAYELGADQAFTMTELAEAVSAISGTDVAYQDLAYEEYKRALIGAGLPEPVAVTLADADAAIVEDGLYVDSGDLSDLIGRPTTTLRDALSAAAT